MSMIPLANAPTASVAENALGALRDGLVVPLQRARSDRLWQLALHGLADGVEDVVVTIRRLAMHERVWRDSMGTRPFEPPISGDPSLDSMQQMVRARADLRSFLLLTDVLLDDAAKALRSCGAPVKPTESFFALAKHLEGGGAGWSSDLLPLTEAVVGLQYSLGYFRDKFVVHRDLVPVTAIYLRDGKVRLSRLSGTMSADDRARGGRQLAALLPVPDAPLSEPYDVRLDIAFLSLRRAEPARRAQLASLLTEFGVISPDPYEAAVEVAETIGRLLERGAKAPFPQANPAVW